MPILSIIVPTYNCCSYLKSCINKLLELKERDIEFIIVNDGSKDDTQDYLDSIAPLDERLKIIHKPNAGVSMARNDAIYEAKGEYLFFSDSDDEIIPDVFESFIEKLKTKEWDLIVANFLNENADLKSTRIYYPRSKTGATNGPNFLIHGLENKEYGSEIYQYFFKKDLFEGISFIKGILHEDDQVLPRVIFRSQKALVTNQNIYFRKFRLNSLSRDEDARPRNNANDLLFVIKTFGESINEYQFPKAKRVFKTLQLRSWMMIFDFYKKVPEKKDHDVLNQKPNPITILTDSDISLGYRFKYFGRWLKAK